MLRTVSTPRADYGNIPVSEWREGTRAAGPGNSAALTPPWRLVLATLVVQGTGVPEGQQRCSGNVNSGGRRGRVGAVVACAPCKERVLARESGTLWSEQERSTVSAGLF